MTDLRWVPSSLTPGGARWQLYRAGQSLGRIQVVDRFAYVTDWQRSESFACMRDAAVWLLAQVRANGRP